MKTPLLLNVLQIFATKANLNYKKTAFRKGDAGFTILELLVIVLMLGILSAIAAPSWLAFINRQRVRTVNDRVFQSLRLAQSEAKRTKRDITIEFDTTVDPPQVKFNPPLATGGSTQTLDGGGEIKKGLVKLSASCGSAASCPAPTALTFNYNGVVDPNTNPTLPLVITVSTVNGGAKKCAIVETIIGGMRTAEGTECN